MNKILRTAVALIGAIIAIPGFFLLMIASLVIYLSELIYIDSPPTKINSDIVNKGSEYV